MRLYLTKNDGAPSLSRRRLFGYEFGLSDEKRGMKLFMKLFGKETEIFLIKWRKAE